MNPKRAAWEKLYREKKDSDADRQQCKLCLLWESKRTLVPHHPRGRHGENILNFIWLHQVPCHQWVHDNMEEAAKLGLVEAVR